MSMAMGGSQGQMDEINVTPLIDVVLVLLIIFMVLIPITVEKMATQLPPIDAEPPPADPDQPPDQLMVAIYKDGTIALNLAPMVDAELETQLKKRLRSKETKTVFVDAHPDANYARVISVMDLARQAGAEHVGFADLKEEGPAQLLPGTTVDMLTAPGAVPGASPTPVPITP
jgi:biopolymer transport protein TolR